MHNLVSERRTCFLCLSILAQFPCNYTFSVCIYVMGLRPRFPMIVLRFPSGPTWSLSPSHHYNGERDLKILNILEKIFFLLFPGDRPLRGESKLYGGVIFITKLLLFHFFRNSQHSEK